MGFVLSALHDHSLSHFVELVQDTSKEGAGLGKMYGFLTRQKAPAVNGTGYLSNHAFHRSSIAVSEGSLRMRRGIAKGNIELKNIAVESLFLDHVMSLQLELQLQRACRQQST